MSILGVPESDELRMLELTQKLFGADDPDLGAGNDAQAQTAVVGIGLQDAQLIGPPHQGPQIDNAVELMSYLSAAVATMM